MPWEKKKIENHKTVPSRWASSPPRISWERHGAREGAGEGGTDGSPTDEPQLCSCQVPTPRQDPHPAKHEGQLQLVLSCGTLHACATFVKHTHTHTIRFWFPSETLRYRAEGTCLGHTAIKWQGQDEAQAHARPLMDKALSHSAPYTKGLPLQPTEGPLLASQGDPMWRAVELLKLLILSMVLSPVSQPGGLKKTMSKHLHRSAKCWAGTFPEMTAASAPRPDDSHPVGPIHSVWIWGK